MTNPPNPDIKRFLDMYFSLFLAKFGRKPIIRQGKDGKLVKEMLRAHPAWGVDTYRPLLISYFGDNSDYHRRNNYSIGIFSLSVDALWEDRRDRRVGSQDAWE